MKLIYVAGGLVLAIAFMFVGLIVAKGPQPEIIVPAEKIAAIGPLNITNTMITAWFVMAFLIIISFLATRAMSMTPSGLQNFVEATVGFLVTQIEDIAGEQKGRQFFALVATIFLFIITANWFGLLPFFNAIGKTEDVGHHIMHELTAEHPHDLKLGEDGKYTEDHEFGAWVMEKSGGVVLTKSGAKAVHFGVFAGETPGEALDRYIVFLARNFADFDVEEEAVEEHDEALTVKAYEHMKAQLAAGEKSPELLLASEAGDHAEEGEHSDEAHALESPALHASVEGVDFGHSKKMALVIPFFRSVYSDVNNTLALGIVAFFAIEFWGFQALGLGYLGKFLNFKSPIMAVVGILELLSEFIRIISFTFRLFGNIFAGEVLILMLTFLMPFLLVNIIYGLELFVGFIQASVFALLTLVFAMMATEHHGEEGHDDHGGDDGADGHHHSGAVQAH